MRLRPKGRSEGSRSVASKGGAGASSMVGPPAYLTDSSVSISGEAVPRPGGRYTSARGAHKGDRLRQSPDYRLAYGATFDASIDVDELRRYSCKPRRQPATPLRCALDADQRCRFGVPLTPMPLR